MHSRTEEVLKSLKEVSEILRVPHTEVRPSPYTDNHSTSHQQLYTYLHALGLKIAPLNNCSPMTSETTGGCPPVQVQWPHLVTGKEVNNNGVSQPLYITRPKAGPKQLEMRTCKLLLLTLRQPDTVIGTEEITLQVQRQANT